MLFKYYFCYGSLILLANAAVLILIFFLSFFWCRFVTLDCQGGLSWVPSQTFTFILFSFSLDNEKNYQCVFFSFYTCIYWWSSHFVWCKMTLPEFTLRPALEQSQNAHLESQNRTVMSPKLVKNSRCTSCSTHCVAARCQLVDRLFL